MNGSFLREFARMVQWTAQAIRLLLVDCKINLYTVILVIIVAQATSLCVFWVLAHYTSTTGSATGTSTGTRYQVQYVYVSVKLQRLEFLK